MTAANSARNSAPVPPAAGDTQYNVPNAALRGASSAFSKPPVKPKPKVNTYTGNANGALLAATKAVPSTPGTPRNAAQQGYTSPVTRHGTGGSLLSRPSPSSMRHLSTSSSASNLVVPDDALDRIPSPSNIAAKLAAARFSPMKPLPQTEPARDVLPPPGSVSHVLARLDAAASRASSTSNSNDDKPKPPREPLLVSQQPQPAVRSPKPHRKIRLSLDPPAEETREQIPARSPPQVRPKPPRLRTTSIDGLVEKPVQIGAPKSTSARPLPPPQRGTRQARPKSDDLSHNALVQRRLSTSLSMESNDNASSPSSFVSAREDQPDEKHKPNLPPPRRSAAAKAKEEASNREHAPTVGRRAAPGLSSPRNMQVPLEVPAPLSPPTRFPSSSPASVYHSNYQRESVKAIAQHMTGESLSNAIVGAALASSRNVSPTRSSTTTPLSIRGSPHHHHHLALPHPHPSLHLKRSPSPQKAPGKLRTTLRKEPSTSSDEDDGEKYKKKGSRVMGMRRKHPNKHHEGTRKRWRDAVTERERKRYEGVWAANKGAFIPPPRPAERTAPAPDPSLEVLDLVTKEIWTRSRLPEHVLEEVWDLVDDRGIGRLRREEFVVGMWLIDQRLKGRKLPPRVSESVWDSVKGVGIKVKVKHGHGHGHGPLHHR